MYCLVRPYRSIVCFLSVLVIFWRNSHFSRIFRANFWFLARENSEIRSSVCTKALGSDFNFLLSTSCIVWHDHVGHWFVFWVYKSLFGFLAFLADFLARTFWKKTRGRSIREICSLTPGLEPLHKWSTHRQYILIWSPVMASLSEFIHYKRIILITILW